MMANKNNYGSWTIPELKIELGKRKARKTGRKHELVSRLEDYDQNQDFGNSADLVDERSYCMQTPEPNTYKDVNANSKLPSLTLKDIDGYLESFQTSLDEKARNLYHERFLICVRASLDKEKIFISARCSAEMKKDMNS